MTDKLKDVLAVAPADDSLDPAVVGKLLDNWGEVPAAEIGAKTKLIMTREIAAFLAEPEYNNDSRFKIATALRKLLDDFGFTVPAAPQVIKIEQDKSFGDMKLDELLTQLADDPTIYADILPFIEQNPRVAIADSKSQGKWAIPAGSGRLNAAATLRYITELNKPGSYAQRHFEQVAPATLATVFGQNVRPLIHPFLLKPVSGPDEFGLDITTADHDDITAVLWARAISHRAYPKHDDPYTFTVEFLSTPRPHRWNLIIEDYKTARAEGNPTTNGITVYWPNDMPHPDSRGAQQRRQPVDPEAEALRELQEMSYGDFRRTGTGQHIRGRVYDRLEVTGTGCSVNDTICLNGGHITGTGCSGRVYYLRGSHFTVTGTGNTVDDIQQTAVQLLARVRR